jgi:hypothetical protein
MIIIPEPWRDVLTVLKEKHPEAIIAGGALRDLVCGVEPADIDYFLLDKPQMARARTSAKDGLRKELEEVLPFKLREYGNVDIQKYEKNFSRISAVFNGELEGNHYQFICLNDFGAGVLLEFDWGICRIAYDGWQLHLHNDFMHDYAHKTFTLRHRHDIDAARNRVNQWQNRSPIYAEWGVYEGTDQ